MRTIRQHVYAATLMLSAVAVQPSLAVAEEARGAFTLSHDVHLQNTVLPAGEYSFSLRPSGPSEILLLQGTGKTSFSAMVLVNAVETPKPDDTSRLVLVTRNGQSYVSALDLPQYDMLLHFTVPSESKGERITASTALGGSSAQ